MSSGRAKELEELASLLVEDGVDAAEIEQTLAGIARFSALRSDVPTSAETDRLVRNLRPHLIGSQSAPASVPAGQRRSHSEVGELLRLAATQLSVLRLGFWIGSAVVMLVGLGLAVSQAGADRAYVLALVGPLLAYLGVAAGFRGDTLGMLEVEFACPVTVRELALSRLLVIVGYQTLVGPMCVVLLRGEAELAPRPVMLMWLAPLLLGLGFTLLLSLWLTPSRAGALVYSAWAGRDRGLAVGRRSARGAPWSATCWRAAASLLPLWPSVSCRQRWQLGCPRVRRALLRVANLDAPSG